jgi:hypothetical protein
MGLIITKMGEKLKWGIFSGNLLTNLCVVSIIYINVVSIGDGMAYVRVQKRGKRSYFYLVRSERNGDRVRQKVIRYLGTTRPSQDQVDRIITEIMAKKHGGKINDY